MWSETKRSYSASGSLSTSGVNLSDPLNVYIISSGFDNYKVPDGGCYYGMPGYSTRIYYRGQQYYRSLPQNNYYSHTLTPNSRFFDCGSNSYVQSHNAARSYHPGGVNVAMCDGSVRFAKDSVDEQAWRSLGSRQGGEVIRADAL